MCVKRLTLEYEACLRQLSHFTRIIAAGNAPAITWLYRGGCLQQLRDLVGAVRDYDCAIARGAELSPPQLAQVYDSRNVCRRQLNDHAGAITDGERAVALAPDVARYHTNLGFARYWAHDPLGALTDLDRALQLDAEEQWAVGYRGMCYQKLGRHEQAVIDFSRILAYGPDTSYQMLIYRARSYVHLERFALAIADCDEAERRTEEDDYRIYQTRGYAHYCLGQSGAALGDLSRAIALNHDLVLAYLWRGLAFRTLGDEAAAAADLAGYATRHPGGQIAALAEIAAMMNEQPPPAGYGSRQLPPVNGYGVRN